MDSAKKTKVVFFKSLALAMEDIELSFAEIKHGLAEPNTREKKAEERTKKQTDKTASFAQLCRFNSAI